MTQPSQATADRSLDAVGPLLRGIALAGLMAAVPPAVHAQSAGSGNAALDAAVRQAQELTQARKPGQAWEILRGVQAQATPTDVAFWLAYADLAWEQGARAEALPAYRRAWDGGNLQVRVPERLVDLYNARGEGSQAVAVGEQAYQRLGEPRSLLLAMDAASRASDWNGLRRLMALAQQNESKFAASEQYWLLQASLADHDGQKAKARSAYGRALAQNPGSVSARVSLLWFEINGGDKTQLAERLQQWQADAPAEPAYWVPYAVGLVQLKRTDEALPWFERQVKAKPDDHLWQLGFAYSVGEAGHPEQARDLRRSIYQSMKGKPGLGEGLSRADRKTLLMAYASMAGEFDGPAASEPVLQDLVGKGYRDADVYELLVGACLAQRKYEAAQRWFSEAASNNHRLPAYQELAIAMGRNDRPAIDAVLRQRESELSVSDRVSGLRKAGRRSDALALVDSSLPQARDPVRQQLEYQQADMRRESARRVEARYESRNLGYLDIDRAEVAASVPTDRGRMTVRLARNRLSSDGGVSGVLISRGETDMALLADLALADPVRVTVGLNDRSDKSLVYGRLEWMHALSAGLNARLDVSVNALTEESAAIRAIGKKDKIAFGLSGAPTLNTFARLEVAGQHFTTRQGDVLGNGSRVEGEFGATLVQGSPQWLARVSGSADNNRLASALPASLVGSVLSPFMTVDSVVARRFSTLGVGTTVRFGSVDGLRRQAGGFLDAWVGRQWPASETAYSLRAAANFPVATAGEFRLEAFYTNVQSIYSSKASKGLALGYRHEF